MRTLTNPRFMIFTESEPDIVAADAAGLPVAARPGHSVASYPELLEKVAALSYHNARFRMLFRGQRQDHKLDMRGEGGTHSCLFPSILRPVRGHKRELLLDSRFERIQKAEGLLKSALLNDDVHLLRVVRWAILQHYEVCDTPLLDVTQSLQTALSFAAPSRATEGYIYVLAIPHLTGPVSVSMESMTQTVDLTQVCPPEALRPHFQSGLLIGDYPEYDRREQTHNRKGFIGNNFACRLITKFHLKDLHRWRTEGFVPTAKTVLFPNDRDSWFSILADVKRQLDA